MSQDLAFYQHIAGPGLKVNSLEYKGDKIGYHQEIGIRRVPANEASHQAQQPGD